MVNPAASAPKTSAVSAPIRINGLRRILRSIAIALSFRLASAIKWIPESNFGEVDRRQVDRRLEGDGLNVGGVRSPSLDGDPDAGINQEAHGSRNSSSVPRRLFFARSMAATSAFAVSSSSVRYRSPRTSSAVCAGGSGIRPSNLPPIADQDHFLLLAFDFVENSAEIPRNFGDGQGLHLWNDIRSHLIPLRKRKPAACGLPPS